MQGELASLRRQLHKAERTIDEQRARLEEQMKAAEKQIDSVRTALSDLNRAARMTNTDFGMQLERLIREVQELRGSLELAQYRLNNLEKTVEGPGSLRERLEALEKRVGEASAVASKPPESSKALFEQAIAFLKKKKVSDALGVYREILRQWPTQPGVADQAHYRIGDVYYDLGKYQAAIQEYIKVYEDFPGGDYVDNALYKIGLSSYQLGNYEDAKIFLGEVLKSHPKSPLVKYARKKLKEIEAKLSSARKTKAKGSPGSGKKGGAGRKK